MAESVQLRVKELAQQRGFNITTLARAAELSYSQASNIWHGRVSQLEFKTLARLAKALRVQIGDLFEPIDTSANSQAVLGKAA